MRITMHVAITEDHLGVHLANLLGDVQWIDFIGFDVFEIIHVSTCKVINMNDFN